MSGSSYVLHRSCATEHENFEVTWKAVESAEATLHWHLRHIFPSMGYAYVSASTKPCRRYGTVSKTLAPVLAQLGFPSHAHIGKSINAMRSSRAMLPEGEAVPAVMSEEYWCSTLGLLLMLLAHASARTAGSIRLRCAACLQMFLQNAVDPWQDCLSDVDDDCRLACWHGLDDEGVCEHLHALQETAVWGEKGVASAGNRLLALFVRRSTCDALQQHLAVVLTRLVDAIHSSKETWTSVALTGGSLSLQGPSGKRRRLDSGERAEAKKRRDHDTQRDDAARKLQHMLRTALVVLAVTHVCKRLLSCLTSSMLLTEHLPSRSVESVFLGCMCRRHAFPSLGWPMNVVMSALIRDSSSAGGW